MRPEPGGARDFTIMLDNQLGDLCAELGRPVTLDELTDAVAERALVPWNGIGQRYQQYKCQANKGQNDRNNVSGQTGPLTLSGYDPALGWHYEGFDIANPVDQRKALRYVINKRLMESFGESHRHWVIRHGARPNWTFERNPDERPMVIINRKRTDWSDGLRALATSESVAAVAAISHAGFQGRLARADPHVAAAVLRWLVSLQPASKSGGARAHDLIREAAHVTKGDPDMALTEMRDYLNTRLPSVEQ